MAEAEFLERVSAIEGLVRQLESVADPELYATARDLMESVLALQAKGLERILDMVSQAGAAGADTLRRLEKDELVGSLLVLHGLHSEDFATRANRALERVQALLHSHGATAELIECDDSSVRVRVQASSGGCGSTKGRIRSAIEDALYGAAPDLSGLVIEGLEESTGSAGFVALQTLTGCELTQASR